jgi:hypothetical protein
LEIYPEFGANFIIGFAVVTIRRSEAREVRHCFDIPYEYVGHVSRLVCCRINFMRLLRLGAT